MPNSRTLTWAGVAVAVAAAMFAVGLAVGRKYERDRFEVLKAFAPVQVDEFLVKGEFDKAIALLHFEKSFEPRVGWTDASLGKAYLAKGQSCLADAFLESGLEWMNREMTPQQLQQLRMFASAQEASTRARTECVAARQAAVALAPKK